MFRVTGEYHQRFVHRFDFIEQRNDQRVQIQKIQCHDAAELYSQLPARMVALEKTERLEEHGKEERDGRDDDRYFVASPVRIVGAILRGAVDHRYDGKGRDGEQIKYEQVDNTAKDDYFPAV